jgi:hypothetical protein
MSRAVRVPAMLAVLTLVAAACGTAAPSAPATTSSPAAAAPSLATPAPTAAVASASVGPRPSGSFDPARFGRAIIDNPWLPLVPGTTLTYRGIKDGEPAVGVFKVTAETKVVDGVTCVVIDDRTTLSGVLAEKTLDYYAQDVDGNVWYLGEDTAELDAKGKVVSTEGTWHGGVDGAVPGIFMNANPKVGDTFIQEFYKGHAEDHFQVLNVAARIDVPYGSFKGALLTKEWTPLEPAVLDNKYYVQGLGEVKEVSVKGPLERFELVKAVLP